MPETPATIYVFGGFHGGHYLYDVARREVDDRPLFGRSADITSSDTYRFEQVEGTLVQPEALALSAVEAIRKAGYSFVAWWDRQCPGDKRPGGYVALYALGAWTPARLIEAARTLAPWAIRVPVQCV